MRAAVLAMLLTLTTAPAVALEVECQNGYVWHGSNLQDCPCCNTCTATGNKVRPGVECPAVDLSKFQKWNQPIQPADENSSGLAINTVLLLFAVGLLCLMIYFIPAKTASRRRHPNSEAIFVLNLLLGWTILGWIAAMVWALTAVKSDTAAAAPSPASGRKLCRACREPIDAKATVCPRCQTKLPHGEPEEKAEPDVYVID